MTVIDGTATTHVEVDHDTLEWASSVSVQALQCRELRHSWPRWTGSPRARKLPSAANIKWEVTATYADGSPAEATREMICTGGCGTSRIETFRFWPGGAVHREGTAKYHYLEGYRRPKPPGGDRLAPLDVDLVRGFVVRRLAPQLKW